MRLSYDWLRELVDVPGDAGQRRARIGLRGFEVAGVDGRTVIDFEITANRPDCLNHMGLAREAAAIWGLPLQVPDMASRTDPESRTPDPGTPRSLDVELDAADLCPRYCAQVFDVKIGPSPAWLQERLEAAGVRPIDNVVDVTNYVMLEMGQPMHAFDLGRLAGRGPDHSSCNPRGADAHAR